MSGELIKQIANEYNIIGNIRKIITVDGYPHINILSSDRDYFIKKVNKIYCKNISTLYNYLSGSGFVFLPIKTINGEYEFVFDDEIYVVYPIFEEINTSIQSSWWGVALKSVHDIEVKLSDFSQDYSIDNESFSLFDGAKEIIDENIKRNLVEMLNTYYFNDKVNPETMVLSHGDPNDSNVMICKNNMGLIDTEGMRLLPREYDIQRLFYNEVNKGLDIGEIDKYIHAFFYNYGNNVDMKLLKKLYVIDLIRTFSWLSLITRDLSRDDIIRQKNELEKYKASILSGMHSKVLKRI